MLEGGTAPSLRLTSAVISVSDASPACSRYSVTTICVSPRGRRFLVSTMSRRYGNSNLRCGNNALA